MPGFTRDARSRKGSAPVGIGHNGAPDTPKPSPAMARVLLNLYRGLPPWRHLEGRSMFGGAGQTGMALRTKGWAIGFGNAMELTETGLEIARSLHSAQDALLRRPAFANDV